MYNKLRGFSCSSSYPLSTPKLLLQITQNKNHRLKYSGIHQRPMSTTSTAGLVIPCKGNNINIEVPQI